MHINSHYHTQLPGYKPSSPHALQHSPPNILHWSQFYANADEQLAVVAVDGIVFRLRRHELMIVRPCSVCGVGQFESPAIATLAELGHALTVWEPRFAHCADADPTNWLDLED